LKEESDSDFPKVLAVESLKFLIPVKNEVKQEYNKKIEEYTKELSFQSFSGNVVSVAVSRGR
jgi:hypothetical protein